MKPEHAIIGMVKPKLKFQSPFDRLRHQMSDVLGDGGILKEVVQPGTGTPVPNNASVLSIALFDIALTM